MFVVVLEPSTNLRCLKCPEPKNLRLWSLRSLQAHLSDKWVFYTPSCLAILSHFIQTRYEGGFWKRIYIGSSCPEDFRRSFGACSFPNSRCNRLIFRSCCLLDMLTLVFVSPFVLLGIYFGFEFGLVHVSPNIHNTCWSLILLSIYLHASTQRARLTSLVILSVERAFGHVPCDLEGAEPVCAAETSQFLRSCPWPPMLADCPPRTLIFQLLTVTLSVPTWEKAILVRGSHSPRLFW